MKNMSPTTSARISAQQSDRSFALHARRWLQNLGPLGVLIVLLLVFEAARHNFLSAGNLAAIAEASAVPVILTTGLSFVILLGAIDLSMEGVMAASSMTLSLLCANDVNGNHWGIWGIAAAIGVGLAFGLVNGLLNTILRMPSLIVTLGTWFIGLGIASILFPSQVPTVQDHWVLSIASTHIAGLSLIVFVAIMLLVLFHLLLHYTHLGRMIFAVGGAEATLVMTGLPVPLFKLAAFIISGLMAGIAGVLLSARLGDGNANIGDGLLFPAVSACVLGGTLLSGGRGGVLPSAIGAVVLEVLNNGLIQIGAGPYVRNIISGAVILIVVAVSGLHLRRKLRVVK
ncbi:ABC transporter permease [Acidisoma cellulosilytica]|uniref:ABC transporter permease n=1 Tax=Acidisoma cellulosilyticum TaxID=2802395 RepID=A0A963Z281_9PROT|nr:ABC transporter permease [Acidisoma cellulosilyticum]MCB8881512.1 ABC transporter permease [Acidisoma cellulosilyticum]